MRALLDTIFTVAVINTLLAYGLTFAWHAGRTGREGVDACARAPLLDAVVGVFTWIPWVVAFTADGWRGLLGSVVGQAIGACIWVVGHERIHHESTAGPRVLTTLDRLAGRWQNRAAMAVAILALPALLVVRLTEAALYPLLVRLLRFPRCDAGRWVNCSHQNFDGLVGRDLLWCLYADWAVGVYSLAGEMLRNAMSFWCPIRFGDADKCQRCAREFPDLNNGWVPADGSIAGVAATLERMYGTTGERAWLGHPDSARGRPTG